jgi:uroporphyrinogen decarboxylase
LKPKEVVLKTLRGEKPDRVPAALIGGGAWSALYSKTTFEALSKDPLKMAKMIVDVSDVLKSDIVYPGSGYPNLPAIALGGAIKFREVGAVDLAGPVITHEEELDGLNVSALDSNQIINTVRTAFDITRKKIGEDYLVSLTAWGPFTIGARIVGEETLIRGVLKKPAFVERVLEFSTELIKRFFEPVVKNSLIELITIGDPTASGDLISRNQYERFALPYIRRFNDWARSKGVLTLLHICGNTTDRLDLFLESGTDCISLDHKTDIKKAREVLGGKLCFAGNIDPVDVLLRGTVEEVEIACMDVIDAAAAGDGGFILMPGCDIPPTVPLENIHAFVEVARQYRL